MFVIESIIFCSIVGSYRFDNFLGISVVHINIVDATGCNSFTDRVLALNLNFILGDCPYVAIGATKNT